jgi:rhodanese-related sulfurtransferase
MTAVRTAPRRTASVLIAILAAYAMWLALVARSSARAEPDVGRIALTEICARIRDGRPPTFVDVREPEEFAEEHIPGAIPMPVREMRQRARKRLASAEVIVPYCLKDFRGFDGARRLVELGFPEVRIMKHFGINAWKAAGLPTAGAIPGRSDEAVQGAVLEGCQRLP